MNGIFVTVPRAAADLAVDDLIVDDRDRLWLIEKADPDVVTIRLLGTDLAWLRRRNDATVNVLVPQAEMLEAELGAR